jgi:hypothetical protein
MGGTAADEMGSDIEAIRSGATAVTSVKDGVVL